MSCLSSLLPQGSCSYFLPSFPHLLCAEVLLFFSDKGDCTPQQAVPDPAVPAVAKRLSERERSHPLKFPYKSQCSSCCYSPALLRYHWCNLGVQQIHMGFMGCSLPLTSTTEEVPKYDTTVELAQRQMQSTLVGNHLGHRRSEILPRSKRSRSCLDLIGQDRLTKISLESQAKSGPLEVTATGTAQDWTALLHKAPPNVTNYDFISVFRLVSPLPPRMEGSLLW